MTSKPIFSVDVLEHGGAAGGPIVRLRFTRQDHTVAPVDFYLDGQDRTAAKLSDLLTELKGSELDPGTVLASSIDDHDKRECAMRIFAGWLIGDRNAPPEWAEEAFARADEFIAAMRRREPA